MRVRYAGFDPNEANPGYYPPQRSMLNRLARRAYYMFRSGLCTLEIAAKLDCTEQRALKLVSIGRSQKKGLPSPYEARR